MRRAVGDKASYLVLSEPSATDREAAQLPGTNCFSSGRDALPVGRAPQLLVRAQRAVAAAEQECAEQKSHAALESWQRRTSPESR
jgi:hypothetical protein